MVSLQGDQMLELSAQLYLCGKMLYRINPCIPLEGKTRVAWGTTAAHGRCKGFVKEWNCTVIQGFI